MKCSCGERMKYIPHTMINLDTTVQAVFYCKHCNMFTTLSYGSPMIVRSQTEDEYYEAGHTGWSLGK